MYVVIAMIIIPLIGSILAGMISFWGQGKLNYLCKIIPCTSMGISSLISFDVLHVIFQQQVFHEQLFTWIVLDSDHIFSWGIYVDTLSAVMLVAVTFVSFWVHIYSLGYMADDKSMVRFMSYLSLFTVFMQVLVSSDNLIQLFVGWEGVGLCSYLLIGFWHHKDSANTASMKAFITNRFGDMGMILGIIGCWLIFDTVSIPQIISKLSHFESVHFNIYYWSVQGYTFICACFLIGAMAKSAQFGLHIWLPDAMEGPTPVSALIHAATMVTAGIFLFIRLSFLFEYVPHIQMAMTYIGAITALFGGVTGLFQKDIKRIIAYSTCSQLGYMFMACGISAYSAALFHLVTHAFFKALLFLSAGSVIHAMSGEQNIYHMGGLYKRIPLTYGLIWVGSLALAGIPFLSGYFSKDWILELLYIKAHPGGVNIPYIIGIIVVGLTALYSWRLIVWVFHGKFQGNPQIEHHVHESPLSMQVPSFVLAIGAIGLGGISYNFFQDPNFIQYSYVYKYTASDLSFFMHYLPTIVTLSGICMILILYYLGYFKMEHRRQHPKYYIQFIQNGFGIDTLYHLLFVRSLSNIGKKMYGFEKEFINHYGSNRLSVNIEKLAFTLRSLQTGRTGDYTIMMLWGVVMMLGYVIMVNP